MVLRKKPPGKLLRGAHAIEREYKIQEALYAQNFPVPKPIHFCKDASVIGTEFYIMEYVDGRIFMDQNLPGLGPDERELVYKELMSVLARLHSLKPAQIGLDKYGKVTNDYFER